jgi:proteasome lid subunit RPN8/RPN11
VLTDIRATVGARPAESGGLLLGPVGVDGVTLFLFDEGGSTTRVTYSPSHQQLTEACAALAPQGLEIKGVCHSHPGLRTPSFGDMEYVARFFDANPSMRRFYMPILPEVPYPHRFWGGAPGPLVDGRNFFVWVVERESPHRYEAHDLRICSVKGMPVWPDEEVAAIPAAGGAAGDAGPCDAACSPIDITRLSLLLPDLGLKSGWVDAGGKPVFALMLHSQQRSMAVLLPGEFPLLGPTVSCDLGDGIDVPVPVCWTLNELACPEERLAELIMDVL